jgi:Ala-tRNA(Pro) deacylase
MTTLQRSLEFLDQNRIRYAHTGHRLAYTASDVAQAEHLSPSQMAKCVIFFSHRTGYGMAVLPADCFVDLEELRWVTGAHHIRLATEPEIGRLFRQCELGAMPPFGNLFDLPVFMDVAIGDHPTISFNAGTHRDVIHMSFSDFRRLVEPRMVSFARKPQVHQAAYQSR